MSGAKAAEWRPVERMPGYEINREGIVRHAGTGRELKRHPHPSSGLKLPYVSAGGRYGQVNVLLLEAFGPGAPEAAGFPAPNPKRMARGREKRGKAVFSRKSGRKSLYSRKCTDCGRPTNDYRCEKCWRIVRGLDSAETEAGA